MAGAYLLLGRTRLVCDYFDFVQASQRKDGHIPFSIYLSPSNGPKTFAYKPPKREGLPPSSQITHAWLGVFDHWRPKEDPISTLGPVCYILTAAEIFDATKSATWLHEKLPSVELTAKYLLGRKNNNGLIDKSGFYIEQPARYQWDGVAQCYVIHAFHEMARCFAQLETRRRRPRGPAMPTNWRRLLLPPFGVRTILASTFTPNVGWSIRTGFPTSTGRR